MAGSDSHRVVVFDKQLTIREQIIRCLEAEPMTARDLSKALRIGDYLQWLSVRDDLDEDLRFTVGNYLKCNCGIYLLPPLMNP